MNRETEYWKQRCQLIELIYIQGTMPDIKQADWERKYNKWQQLVNTPIPSDNEVKGVTDGEIADYAFMNYPAIDNYPATLTDGCFIDGAKWMRSHCQNIQQKEIDWDRLWQLYYLQFVNSIFMGDFEKCKESFNHMKDKYLNQV
jgi:hypothetical protein